MLRIYLTDSGVEGYFEGCGCCSYNEKAGIEDIDKLIIRLDNNKKRLRELKFILSRYGEANLIAWKSILNDIRHYESRLEASKEYETDNKIQGTFYKSAYESREEDAKTLKQLYKFSSKIPPLVEKYIKGE